MTETDIWKDDYATTEASVIQTPPEDDGYYKVRLKLLPKNEEKSGRLYSVIFLAPEAGAGHSGIRNFNDPQDLANRGKLQGAQLTLADWKAAFKSAEVKDADVIKAGSFEARAKLLDGKEAYVYFEPAILVDKSDYARYTFVPKASYDANVSKNGSRMAALKASGGDTTSATAKTTKVTDEKLKDLA